MRFRRKKKIEESTRRVLSKDELRQLVLRLVSEKGTGISWDELYDAARAEGDVSWTDEEAPRVFHDVILSLEKEGLIRSEFATTSRLYYPRERKS